jgi:phytanoyl-CoA hydroxylase
MKKGVMTMSKPLLNSYKNEKEQALAKNIAKTMYKYDNIIQDSISSPDDLTEDHVKQFWNKGFIVVNHVLNKDEVNQSLDALMDILFERVKGPKIQFVKPVSELKNDEQRELAVRKIDKYADYDSRLKNVVYHQNMTKILRSLFKGEPKLIQDQALLKPPHGGAEKPWHQDMAYGALTFTQSVIGVWLALDPAELDNGCMHVIPYSHMKGAVPHYSLRDWQLCDRNVDVDEDIAIPLKPGDALFFSGLLHHGTPPNFSTKRRRALQIHYAPESAVKMSPKEYKLMFTNEMTGAEC